jgi:hypothetical protein
MESSDTAAPSLVEPGMKSFIATTLKQCHDYKMKTYTFFLNLAVLVVFVGVFGGFLYYRYKNKPTPYELRQKTIRDQQIIMSKIHSYQDDKKRATYKNMTGIPFVDTDYYTSKLDR